MKKNIVVVGSGYWGQNLVRNFAEIGSLAAVCDQNHETARIISEKYATKALSFSEALSDSSVEGVALAVPAALHAEMGLAVMAAGKHLFVEKPLAISRQQALSMIDASIKYDVRLMVGHLLQYHPAFTVLKEICRSSVLGNIRSISSSRLSYGKVRSAEDVIWSFAPHDLSMVLSLVADSKVVVSAVTQAILQPDVADIASINLDFESGIQGSISVSWLHPHKEQQLVVIGSDGMAVFDDRKPWPEKVAVAHYRTERSGSSVELGPVKYENMSIVESEPLKNECNHFMEVVNASATPITDGIEGLKVLTVLSAASESAATRTRLLVDI